MGPIRNPNWSTSRMRVTLSYLCVTICNPVEKQKTNNTKCSTIPNSMTAQYQNSFFVDTVIRWNHLPDTVAYAKSLEAFKTALAAQRQ